MNEQRGLCHILGRLDLITPLRSHDQLMHLVALGPRYADGDASLEEQHRTLGLIDKVVQVPQRLRTRSAQRFHARRLPLVLIRSSVRSEEIHLVAPAVYECGAYEWIIDIWNLTEGFIDAAKHLE